MTLRLNGSASGYVEIDAPAVAGSTSITLPATSGGEFVVSDSNGRVGIGTTSPGSYTAGGNNLVVNGSGNIGLTIASSDSNATNIYFADSTSGADAYRGIIRYRHSDNNMVFYTDATERAAIDSSGRFLVGTSSSGCNDKLTVQSGGTAGSTGRLGIRNANATSGLSSGGILGVLDFGARATEGDTYASITAAVDGTPGTNDYPGRLVFSTTADGASSPTQAMVLSNDKRFYLSSTWYNNITTANAANVHAVSNGEFYRSTSSIKYKTDVETLQDSYADAILNVRPVWYRSTCQDDNPNHSWWGFIAEEVAEIDPRLVQWKTKEITYDGNGFPVETSCKPEPEGIAYDRFVPHLLNLIKRQKEQLETQAATIAAFETRLTALEGGTNP